MRRSLCTIIVGVLAAFATPRFLAHAEPSAVKPVTVLFDEGHGQRFSADGKAPLDLSVFASLFEAEGCIVGTGVQQVDDTILSGADLLVISGPFRPYSPEETDAVVRFIERGGRVAVMLHIAAPVVGLLERLGVLTSNGVIREHDNLVGTEATNFHVTKLEPHALTSGVERFDMLGVWALNASDRSNVVVARTGPAAWIDLNGDGQQQPRDAMQSFAVVVTGQRGAGRFAVFGDDALFQNEFLKGGNEALARNLVRWMK